MSAKERELTTPTSNSELQRWNERFSAPGYLFGKNPSAFLASQAHWLDAGSRALSIADGDGRNGVWLAKQGLSVVSVDFSAIALEKAAALAKLEDVSIETIEADITSWDWPEAAFDIVVAIFFQFAAPEVRGRIFNGIKSALRPNGLLLLQGYRPEQLDYGTGGPPHRENMYTEALLREAFGDMEFLHFTSHDTVIEEGAGHNGMSALVDLVARK